MSSFAPDLLECLAAIVEEDGFERAATRLSITQSAVSQRLRALETQVGTVLIVRSRPLKPTSAGKLLLRHAMHLRLMRADLDHDLRNLSHGDFGIARDEDRISIAINADSIATWALPALNDLVCDGLPLEIITDDQDFTHDWLREGQVLGCVTTLKQALRGCKVAPLGAMHYVAVASTRAIARYCPEGINPRNLGQLPFIAFNRKDDLQSVFVSRALKLKHVNLRQRFVPSSDGQVRAALAGWGASVVPELLVRPLIAAGQLTELVPGFRLPVSLYWHCWNLDSIVLNSLSASIVSAAARALKPEPTSPTNSTKLKTTV